MFNVNDLVIQIYYQNSSTHTKKENLYTVCYNNIPINVFKREEDHFPGYPEYIRANCGLVGGWGSRLEKEQYPYRWYRLNG